MKKITSTILVVLVLFSLGLTACKENNAEVPSSFDSADAVIEYMLKNNEEYIKSKTNSGNVSVSKREETAEKGQKPYAVVITCSDSRVPAEHVFNAGIGELFVIRTAGNVIGDFELGSVEYGAEHLGTKLVLVLGHTQCGAVDAAISGGAHGYIKLITDEIKGCIGAITDARQAEKLNVENSINKIMQSEIMAELSESGAVAVRGAIYNISTGKVEML